MIWHVANNFMRHGKLACTGAVVLACAVFMQGCGGGTSGDVVPLDGKQSAKEMVQMVRDVTSSVQRAGFDMEGIIDSVVDAQDALQRQVDTTRGFTSRLEHIMRIMTSLEGQPPGEYEYRWDWGWRLYRIASQPQGTEWRVKMYDVYDQTVPLTIRSQNVLSALHLTPVAGKYSVQALAQGISYSGELVANWDAGTRDIRFTFQQVTLSDPELSGPVTFSGDGAAKLASDASADKRVEVKEMTLTGEFESPYGTLHAQRVTIVWDPHWNENNSLVSLDAQSLSFSLRARPVQGELTNVTARLKRLQDGELLAAEWLEVEQMDLQTGSDKVELKSLQAQFVDYPDASNPEDTALSSLTARINLKGLRGEYSGQVSATWNNPKPLSEWNGIEKRLSTFPKGEVTFSGSFSSLGVPSVQIENMRARFAPDASPPAFTIVATMRQGEKTIEAQWQSELVQMGRVEISRSTVTATYQPSGVRLEVNIVGDRIQGTLTAQDGTRLAAIAKAKDIGLPDLGDTVVVKYSDGTFETLDSLWLGRL